MTEGEAPRIIMRRFFRQEQSEVLDVPLRTARALLRECVNSALPENTYIEATNQNEDTLWIKVSHKHLEWVCTLSVEYLTDDRSRRIFAFPPDASEEPSANERTIMDKDPAMCSELAAHYARRRERQAQRRQIRDALLEGMRARWDALLATGSQGEFQAPPLTPREQYESIISQAQERAQQHGLSRDISPTVSTGHEPALDWFLGYWFPTGKSFERFKQQHLPTDNTKNISKQWEKYRKKYRIPSLTDLKKLQGGV